MNLVPTETRDLDATRCQSTAQFSKLLRMTNTTIAAACAGLGLLATAEPRSVPKDVGVLRLTK